MRPADGSMPVGKAALVAPNRFSEPCAGVRVAPASNRVFSTLNGMRGIAAGLIVVRHATLQFPGWNFPSSYLAVDLFFVMSGFVMASAYGARLNDGLTPYQFMMTRLVRLYPLYLLGLALGVGAVLIQWSLNATSGPRVPALLASVVFGILILPNPLRWNDHIFPLNSPSWSLFFELAANVAYACAHRAITTPRLVLFIVVANLSVGVLTGWGLRMEEGHSWNEYLGVGLARVSYGFAMGILLFRLHGRRRQSSILAMLVLCLVAATLTIPSPGPVGAMVLASVVLPMLVFAGAHVEPSAKVREVFEILGRLSYPIYMIHAPAVAILTILWPVLGIQHHYLWEGIAFVVVLGVVSHWADSYYDRPGRAFLRRRILRSYAP